MAVELISTSAQAVLDLDEAKLVTGEELAARGDLSRGRNSFAGR